MQFNSVDIEGVEFYKIGDFRDYRNSIDYDDTFAFEQRFEKKRWVIMGNLMTAMSLLVAISFVFLLFAASAIWPHPVIVLAAGLLGIIEGIGIFLAVLVVFISWIIGSMAVAFYLGSCGMAMANAREKGPSIRRRFTSGWYNAKALISSKDFAFEQLRSLVEAAKTKEEVSEINGLFTKDISMLHESLRYKSPLKDIKRFKLEIIDAIETFVHTSNTEASIDFKQLREKVETDYLAAVKAKVAKKERELIELRTIVT